MMDFKRWRKVGIFSLKDLVVNNRIVTLREMQTKLQQNNANTFFEYNTIINAIPQQWKEWVRNGLEQQQPLEYDTEIDTFKNKPRVIREYLKQKTNTEIIKPLAIAFWKRKLNYQINRKTWELPRNATKEVRLRVLQWKIIHNLYPTNILLKKMGVCTSHNCSTCTGELDTMEHFFCNCKAVKPFWGYVEKIISSLLGTRCILKTSDILFGVESCKNVVVNHIILIGKMCISKVKKTNSQTPIEIVFENEINVRKILLHA